MMSAIVRLACVGSLMLLGAFGQNGCLPESGFQLAVSVVGGGSIDPPGGTFKPDESVTVTATPSVGYAFDHWVGGALGTENPATITMDADKAVTAVFVPQYDLTVAVQGNGQVAPAGGAFAQGATVVLTATAADGSAFDHWQGDVTADEADLNPLTLTINKDTTVTAVFQSRPRDGSWAGYTSSGDSISFQVSKGGTLISGFKLSYSLFTSYCLIDATSSWSGTYAIDDDGSFWASVGSLDLYSDYIRVSGTFSSDTEAAGESLIMLYDYDCGFGTASPTWSASWRGE